MTVGIQGLTAQPLARVLGLIAESPEDSESRLLSHQKQRRKRSRSFPSLASNAHVVMRSGP